MFKPICFILVLSVLLLLICSCGAQRRRKTTTTTTAMPDSLVDREANLAEREENFRIREENFRGREENLVAREEKLKEREDQVSKREGAVDAREKAAGRVKGKCPGAGTGTASEEDAAVDMATVRLYEHTGKYVEIGSTESCSQNMRFFSLAESETFGDCDCDYHQCSRPLIYSDKYVQCFWAWTQGPCEQKEWFVYNATTYEPVCEPNPCPESPAIATTKFYFQNPEDGQCYQTTTRGYCRGKGERLLTAPGEPIPQCRKQTVCAPVSIPAEHRCYPGYKRWQNDQC